MKIQADLLPVYDFGWVEDMFGRVGMNFADPVSKSCSRLQLSAENDSERKFLALLHRLLRSGHQESMHSAAARLEAEIAEAQSGVRQ